MSTASAKMGIALRSKSGMIPEPPVWLVNVNKVDSFIQRGYSMKEIDEMEIDFVATLTGIMEAEADTARRNK